MSFRRGRFLLATLLGLTLTAFQVQAGTAQEEEATADEVRQEISETLKAIGNYSADQRDAAVATAREALAVIDARLDQLQERFDRNWQKMSEAARKDARDTLKKLQAQRTEIAEWYGGLKHSSVKAWEEIKKGFAHSYSAMTQSLEEARKEF